MCSKSCLVQSKKQPLDVAKLVEARWPGLRTEYCKLQQGFEGLYDFFCCEGDASMCFNEGGDKGSRFEINFVLSSLNAFLSFPC